MKQIVITVWLAASTVLAAPTNFTPASAAAHLKLTPPVAVEAAGAYLDGGSIAVTLVDLNTNKFHMFEDYSLRTTTGGRIYVADDKPRRGGRLASVEEGIAIKSAVVCLARDWAERTTHVDVPERTRETFEIHLRIKMENHARDFILRKWKRKEPTSPSTRTQ